MTLEDFRSNVRKALIFNIQQLSINIANKQRKLFKHPNQNIIFSQNDSARLETAFLKRYIWQIQEDLRQKMKESHMDQTIEKIIMLRQSQIPNIVVCAMIFSYVKQTQASLNDLMNLKTSNSPFFCQNRRKRLESIQLSKRAISEILEFHIQKSLKNQKYQSAFQLFQYFSDKKIHSSLKYVLGLRQMLKNLRIISNIISPNFFSVIPGNFINKFRQILFSQFFVNEIKGIRVKQKVINRFFYPFNNSFLVLLGLVLVVLQEIDIFSWALLLYVLDYPWYNNNFFIIFWWWLRHWLKDLVMMALLIWTLILIDLRQLSSYSKNRLYLRSYSSDHYPVLINLSVFLKYFSCTPDIGCEFPLFRRFLDFRASHFCWFFRWNSFRRRPIH